MMTAKDIELSDIPESVRDIAIELGFQTFLRVLFVCGGEQVYLPKLDRVLLRVRNRCIRTKFNGRNHRELARRYSLSVSRIRVILSEF